MTNAGKHSEASKIEVELSRTEELIVLRVRDDGHGFDVDREAEARGGADGEAKPSRGGGFGLGSMKERVEGLGGKLLIDSAPGEGATVVALLLAPRPAPRTARGAARSAKEDAGAGGGAV